MIIIYMKTVLDKQEKPLNKTLACTCNRYSSVVSSSHKFRNLNIFLFKNLLNLRMADNICKDNKCNIDVYTKSNAAGNKSNNNVRFTHPINKKKKIIKLMVLEICQ